MPPGAGDIRWRAWFFGIRWVSAAVRLRLVITTDRRIQETEKLSVACKNCEKRLIISD